MSDRTIGWQGTGMRDGWRLQAAVAVLDPGLFRVSFLSHCRLLIDLYLDMGIRVESLPGMDPSVFDLIMQDEDEAITLDQALDCLLSLVRHAWH